MQGQSTRYIAIVLSVIVAVIGALQQSEVWVLIPMGYAGPARFAQMIRAMVLSLGLAGCSSLSLPPVIAGSASSVFVIGLASGCGQIGLGVTSIHWSQITENTNCNLAIITPDMETVCKGENP
jgi:hypothetical protein